MLKVSSLVWFERLSKRDGVAHGCVPLEATLSAGTYSTCCSDREGERMASPLPDGTRSTQPQNLDLSQCYLHPIPVTKEFDLVVYRSPSLTWTLTSSTTLGEDCPAKERMSQLEEGELRIAFKNLRTRIPQNFAFQQLQQVKVGVTSVRARLHLYHCVALSSVQAHPRSSDAQRARGHQIHHETQLVCKGSKNTILYTCDSGAGRSRCAREVYCTAANHGTYLRPVIPWQRAHPSLVHYSKQHAPLYMIALLVSKAPSPC